MTDEQLQESYDALLTKITFLNEDIIPQKIWEEAENILSGIDIDDIDFIAMTKFLKGKLWTGDLELSNGLRKRGFKNVTTTPDLLKKWRNKKEG